MRKFLNAIKAAAQEKFNGIKAAVCRKINAAREAVKTAAIKLVICSNALPQTQCGKRTRLTLLRTFIIPFRVAALICGENLGITVPPVKNMILILNLN